MRNKLMVLSCVLALVFFLGAVSLAGAEAEPKVGQVVGISGVRKRRPPATATSAIAGSIQTRP